MAVHRAWNEQTREITDRAIELIRADRRSGEVLDWKDALLRAEARPRRDYSQLRFRRPEPEVAAEVSKGDRWATQMVQTDDWPPITMPGTGTVPVERDRE